MIQLFRSTLRIWPEEELSILPDWFLLLLSIHPRATCRPLSFDGTSNLTEALILRSLALLCFLP